VSPASASAWTLAAVGDVMLEHPPAPDPLHALLREADAAFANLEAPLCDAGFSADKLITMRSDPAVAPALRALGLGVVSFAHNHSLDYGYPGLLQTLEVVRAAGVQVVGAGATLADALRPAYTEAGGRRVAWLAFAATLPPGWAATPDRPGVAPIRVRVRFEADASVMEEQPGTSPYVSTEVEPHDLDQALGAVRAAAAEADVVIASVHWGVPPGWAAPFQGLLADYQQPLGRALVEAGAAAVLGHHPHTLHGIEVWRGRPILYSLGNFIFHTMAEGRRFALGRPAPPYRMEAVRPPELRHSALFRLEFAGDRCARITVHPAAADAGGEYRAAGPAQASAILDRMQTMCAALGASLDVAGGIGRIEIAPRRPR
jgi:poly-gamma-glutamate synthesis protein (capsule biosynthesis protein)